MRPRIWSAGLELFAQYVLQMDQRVYGTCCSCLVIIYSLYLAMEILVHPNAAAGCYQIPVQYPGCILAAMVVKDFGQSKFVFLYYVLQTPHLFFFSLLRSLVTFRKVSKLADEVKIGFWILASRAPGGFADFLGFLSQTYKDSCHSLLLKLNRSLCLRMTAYLSTWCLVYCL